MNYKMRKIIISLVGLFVISILTMTWFYPYSIFSIHKSYSFTPDTVVVDGYVKDLNAFKSLYKQDLKELGPDISTNLTRDRTQYLLPLFEQDWLVSKQPVKMNMEDLSDILLDVENVRRNLLELLIQEDYTKEQRMYLGYSIEGLLSLEAEIIDIQTGEANSRKILKNQVGNLHIRFLNNFRLFENFYERSRNK